MGKSNPDRGASRYPKIVAFVRETPWAIIPAKLHEIQQMIELHVRGETLSEEQIQERIGAGPARRDATQTGSVAVIPIYGVITPKADLMTNMSGGTSIDRLQQALRAAVADPNISAVVLDVNSPGGSVSMLTEMASEIRAARRVKPVVAVANTIAGSAAYQLASQASEVVVSPSGSVGSIGTIAMHDDVSAAMEMEGVKTTVVTSSKFKGELSPFQPLSEDAKAELQRVVDAHGRQFEQDVARGRGVPVDRVRSDFGQGRMLMAKDALAVGMVDRVDTLDNVIRDLLKRSVAQAGLPEALVSGEVTVEISADTSSAAAGLAVAQALAEAAAVEFANGPIPAKSTATTDVAWDGPQMKANLSNDQPDTYRQAFAWFDSSGADPDGDGYPDNKGDYKFIHHMVSAAGEVGAANVIACSQGIAVLNGGRTGTTIPDADRQGVWEHLARHLRDAGREPPPLRSLTDEETPKAAMSGLSFADQLEALRDDAEAVLARFDSLAEVKRGALTGAKRDRLTACTEALRETVTALENGLTATRPNRQADLLLRERLRFEKARANL